MGGGKGCGRWQNTPDLMDLDGNSMVVLMTNAEQFGEIHVNRDIESRPLQKIELCQR